MAEVISFLTLIPTALGIAIGLALVVISVTRGFALQPDTITPSKYLLERVKTKPVKTGQFEPDTAWPFYPLRQLRADLRTTAAELGKLYPPLWDWPVDTFFLGENGSPWGWWIFFPLPIAVFIILLATSVTIVAVYGLFAAVAIICSAASLAIYGTVVLLLRGAEGTWQAVMHAQASCPHCYLVTPRPAYKCFRCGRLHRDIRSGRLGLFARRCTCDALLPTMVLRAAWRLEALCQRCGTPLRHGAAAVRDTRIPIFGDTSAGKTRFLYAALDSLVDPTRGAGIELSFPDETSKRAADLALSLIRSGRETVKTPSALPVALTCQVGSGSDKTLVHLFDAAGENYRDSQMHDALGFLGDGHGLVYVLDPFSIGLLRDQMTGQSAVVIRLAHAAAGSPEIVYSEVTSRLRDSGVKAAKQRLAVVVSKADLLAAGGIEVPAESDALAAWITDMGVHNLVLSARHDFAEVRYFAVASLAAVEASPAYDAGAPLRWLLRSQGVRLPPEPLVGATEEGQQ